METAELLGEFFDSLADAARHGDLAGHLAAWRKVATGAVTPETPAIGRGGGCSSIDELALRLCATGGGCTSGELARMWGCTGESARQHLCALASQGRIVAHGFAKGRWYSLPKEAGIPPLDVGNATRGAA